MAPQPRGDVPPKWKERLIDVAARLKATRAERDEVISGALKAGASIREVAKLVGLSHAQVLKIGHANGWPTPAMLAERERRAAENREWNEGIEEAMAELAKRRALPDED